VGKAEHRHPPQGHRIALPRDHPTRRRLHQAAAKELPSDVINVYIPEYVVGRWWENVLHNQSSLRLKARLLFEPAIIVTSVPWQLRSSERRNLTRPEHRAGDVRNGINRAASD
jgi:hypothetical protein